MRLLRLFFLLLPSLSFGSTYYVATNGNASNSGLSTVSPWDFNTAFGNVRAGDTVYVKAGNYGDLEYITAVSGTQASPIVWIGYNTTPGDINASNGPSFTYADYVSNGSDLVASMPLIVGNRTNSESSGTFMDIRHPYWEFHNFMVKFQDFAFYLRSSNATVTNIISANLGNFNPADTFNPCFPNACTTPSPDLPAGGTSSLAANLTGNAIWISGDNNVIRNSIAINCGARGFVVVSASGNLVEWSEVHSDQNVNPTDYYVMTYGSGASGNIFRNIEINRHNNLTHRGHGLSLKCGATNNTYENVNLYHTSVELNKDANNNTFNSVKVYGQNYGGFPGGIKLDSGSFDNFFSNCAVFNGEGIIFLDSIEGDCANGCSDAGSGNIFVNLIVADASVDNLAPLAFHWNSQTCTGAGFNNKFYNCTFDGSPYLYRIDRPATGNEFINCSFSYMPSGLRSSRFTANTSDALTSTYSSCNFFSTNFTTPSGTDISTGNPQFTNRGADDYTITGTSALINSGIATPYPYDHNGNERTGTFDIGAFEFGSASPPADVTPPAIVSAITDNIGQTSFTTDVLLNENTASYKVEYRQNPAGTISSSATITTVTNRHIVSISGLTSNTTYDWRAVAEDAAANSTTGDWNTVSTLQENTSPPESILDDLRAILAKILKW